MREFLGNSLLRNPRLPRRITLQFPSSQNRFPEGQTLVLLARQRRLLCSSVYVRGIIIILISDDTGRWTPTRRLTASSRCRPLNMRVVLKRGMHSGPRQPFSGLSREFSFSDVRRSKYFTINVRVKCTSKT